MVRLIFNRLIWFKLLLLLGRLVDIQLLILQVVVVVVGINLRVSRHNKVAISRRDVLELILIGYIISLLVETVQIVHIGHVD